MKLAMLAWMMAAAGMFCLPAAGAVKVDKGNGVIISMENDAVKLDIAVEAGGRLSKLINKKTGRNLVSLWKGFTDVGGALDDRDVFTSFAYRAAVTRDGGDVGQVRLSAQYPGGLAITKTITLRDGQSTVEVSETLENGGQKPIRFMLRHFLLPGDGPLSEEDQYFVPIKGSPLAALTAANGYYDQLESPWAALWNKAAGEGILAAAPGIEKFYFWTRSKENPTFEWVYQDVPAGKSLSVQFALRIVNEQAPDWRDLSARTLKELRQPVTGEVAGWQNEEQRYQVTGEEKARGFWLSTGDDKGKHRLPDLPRIDAPLKQSRSVYVGINALREMKDATCTVELKGVPDGLLQTAWQQSSTGFIAVVPFNGSTKINLGNGTEGRLWLTINASAHPVDVAGTLLVVVDGQEARMPLAAKVWAVDVPEAYRPFDVRGYGGFASMAGGYELTPAALKQMETILTTFAAMGGNVMDLAVSWGSMDRHLEISGGGQTVSDWLKKNQGAYQSKPAGEWPGIDFGYYDPWFASARTHGLTRVNAYLPLAGKESDPIEQQWRLMQLKAYLQTRGFGPFFCKISDEIPPSNIPAYIESAKVAQAAGWRPFTTITGLVASTAGDINTLNPYCDEWQLGITQAQRFENLIRQAYQIKEMTAVMPARWRPYDNGGAQNTVSQRLIPDVIAGSPADMESIEVFQDGKPLARGTASPWGNKRPGVYFTRNSHLYVSPLEGTDVNQATITVKYRQRVAAEKGEPLAKIDPTDEIWFYTGSSSSYRVSYEQTSADCLLALGGGYHGYGWYAFYKPWNTDKVVWYDDATGQISVSPAYLGLKDGWNDARLLGWLVKENKTAMDRFISNQTGAPLRMDQVQWEAYNMRRIVNLGDPFVLNDARRKMLEAAGK